MRTENKVIYFDPAYMTTYFSTYSDKTEFSKWPNPIDGLPNRLEKADIICISHHHKDHCKKVTINRLRKRGTKVFAPKTCMAELGGDSFQIVYTNDIIQIDKETILEVVDAYNTEIGSSTQKQHRKGKGCGYILTLGELKVYHLGDTDFLPEMKSKENIDIAFVPMGGKFTMDADEAIEATKAIKPTIVIPIHKLDKSFEEFAAGFKKGEIKCIIPEIGQPILL